MRYAPIPEATSGRASDSTPKRRRAAAHFVIHALLLASLALNAKILASWVVPGLLPQHLQTPGAASSEQEAWEGQEASLGAQRRFAWESFVIREEEALEEGTAPPGPVTDRRHKPKVGPALLFSRGECQPYSTLDGASPGHLGLAPRHAALCVLLDPPASACTHLEQGGGDCSGATAVTL